MRKLALSLDTISRSAIGVRSWTYNLSGHVVAPGNDCLIKLMMVWLFACLFDSVEPYMLMMLC